MHIVHKIYKQTDQAADSQCMKEKKRYIVSS